MSDKTPDFTHDPYWGKGGSYVVDPTTGKRSPAPAPEPVPAQAGQRPDAAGEQADSQGLAPALEANPAKTLKEKRRA